MKAWLALPLCLLPSAAAAEPPAWAPGLPWAPTAPYVVAGQDEPGYQNWYVAAPAHASSVKAFNDYLVTYGVGGVVPTWQLLRTASDWYKCGAAAFEVPPPAEWPNIVQTLRFVRDRVVPAIGPVEPVSVYRNPALNRCAGGAQESAHRFTQAVDMVPLRPITRDGLIRELCALHERNGQPYGVGLGFYVGLRFHVDSRKFRTWGSNNAGTVACAGSQQLARALEAASSRPATAAVPQEPAPGEVPQPAAQPSGS